MFHHPLVLFFGFGETTRTFFPTLKPLIIIDGALFVVYFVLNTLFLLVCGISTCNCMSCPYLFPVYTVNTPSTDYCLFLTAENVPLTFGVFLRSWKHQPYLCSYFQRSKYVGQYLVCCLSACKYAISAVLRHFNS